MKKNLFFGLLAMGAMMFTTSCQEEEIFDGAQGDTDVVTFTVNTLQVATRAATGEGALADKLYYGVYEYVNNQWSLIDAISMTETSEAVALPADGTIVNIRLAKQKKYSIIFWAENDAVSNGLCNVDWTAREMSINSSVNSNQENYDAFWAYDEIESFTGALKKEVSLVRPFAQLNIGVSEADWQAAVDASAVVSNSAVTVKGVPTTMSLVDGTVSGEGNVVYASAAIPSNEDWTFPVSGYRYLALNYVLVGNEQSLIDVDLEYTDTENGCYTNAFTAVPVKRNYRTNIYGDLLTGNADYNVKIDGSLSDDDQNVDETGTTRTSVATIAELQAAIDAANAGETTIIQFEQDINANSTRAASIAEVTILQKEGVNLVINGRGYKFEGMITVDGNGRSTGAETLTFMNINFETASSENFTFINAPSKINNRYNYSHNVTIENCNFAYTGGVESVEIGSASFTSTYNIVMKNCTATNMHSMIQIQSCDNKVLVDNVKTVNCKNGVSFGNTAYPTLTNSTIEAREYGVRADGNASRGNLVIENTTVNAKKPVIVRKMTTNTYNIDIKNGVELNPTTTGDYQVVFTAGQDDAEYVTPTGSYTLTGAVKGLKVFPVVEVYHEESGLYYNTIQKSYLVYDAADLVNAATYFSGQTHSGEGREATISLLSDIDLAGQTWTPWSVMFITVNANGHTISNLSNSFFGYAGAVKVNGLTLENVSSTNAEAGTFAGRVEGGTFSSCVLKGENFVTYNADGAKYGAETEHGVGAISGVAIQANVNVTIAEGASVVVDMNTIENTEKTTFADFLNGYKHTTYVVNNGSIVNNGSVSVKASAPIVANAKGVTYTGDVFNDPLTDAFVLQNSTLKDNATITIKRQYKTVALEEVTADVNDNLIMAEIDNTIVLWNCDITLPEGKKLIVTADGVTVGQVILYNVKVNGELLTHNTAADYLQGVGGLLVY